MADKSSEITQLFGSFEDCRFDHDGVEAWSSRDLAALFGYKAWQDFRNAIRRAWTATGNSGHDPQNHFLVGDGSESWHPDEVFRGAPKNPLGGRPAEDVIVTRLAAYYVAMNGDPRKPEIAFAQHYFASATRTLEVLQKRMLEADRLTARGELRETEAKFQGVLYEHDVDGPGIGRIRSKGDEALFGGKNTEKMKKDWGVKGNKPLADVAPEVVIRAKQLSAAITTHNVKTHNMRGEAVITVEHVTNNQTVRSTVAQRGIVLEDMEPEEDIKKVERRHAADIRKLSKPASKKPTTKKKGVTKKQMQEWFEQNYCSAVQHARWVDGEWVPETHDPGEVLSDQFPDASQKMIQGLAAELDAEDAWVSSKIVNDLLEDGMHESMIMAQERDKNSDQSERFIEKARELGVDESEKGEEKAFGKVGMKKPSKGRKSKKGSTDE